LCDTKNVQDYILSHAKRQYASIYFIINFLFLSYEYSNHRKPYYSSSYVSNFTYRFVFLWNLLSYPT
jgi:hypothetical protein